MRVLVVVLLLGAVAYADDVDELVAQGQALAQSQDYTRAIEAFKQADARRPRAAHACMIGLAYMRRELWPQAELFLALCEKRAVPGDQPPPWIDEAEHQLAAKLSAARIPAITITVAPGGVPALLRVSSFAPDERFSPQTIHLAPGKHTIEVSAPGFVVARREIEVLPAEPQSIAFDLVREGPTVIHAAPRAPAPSGPSSAPWILLGTGGALAVAAAIVDVAEVGPARDKLSHAQTGAAYDQYEGDYSTKRWVTVGLAGGAAAAIVTGLVLRRTLGDRAPSVTASATGGGAALSIEWQR